jgi:hypothetical protein
MSKQNVLRFKLCILNKRPCKIEEFISIPGVVERLNGGDIEREENQQIPKKVKFNMFAQEKYQTSENKYL